MSIGPGKGHGNYAFHWFNDANTPNVIRLVELDGHKTVRDLATNSRLRNVMKKTNLSVVDFFEITSAEGVDMEGFIIKKSFNTAGWLADHWKRHMIISM